MRKYFLLSAIALLTATNVNAESKTYTVEAQAKVALSAKAECTTWDWGTIYLTDLNITDLSLSVAGHQITATGADADKFTNIGGYSPAKCEWTDNEVTGAQVSNLIVPDEVQLVGNASSIMLLTDIEMDRYGVLSGTLKLDDVYGAVGYIEGSDYKGSFVMTAVY